MYSLNTCFKRLNIDIQWVLIFRDNNKPLVSNVFARLTKSRTFSGLCEKGVKRLKYTFNACNQGQFVQNLGNWLSMMCNTTPTNEVRGNLLPYLCNHHLDQMSWNIKSPPHRRQIHLEVMSSFVKPPYLPLVSKMHF